MNPYLTQRYGAALHHANDEEDELPDASVGWGRFPTSTHMQHKFISLPNRSPPRAEPVVPEQVASPPAVHHVDEPQTAAAARRQSNPLDTFEGSELFTHDVLKSTYVDPAAKEVQSQFQPTQGAQITAYLPMDVDSVLGKRMSRRAQLHVMPIDPTVRALEESQEAAARSEEKRQYEQMRRELERTHEALEVERETRRKDIRAAKRDRESRRDHKRRDHRRQPHTDATTITPEVLSTILTSVYANIPRPSAPAQTPPIIEVTAEEDTKAKLAKRIDAIYGAQTKREVAKGDGEASKSAFLPRPLPRVNIPLSANVFFDEGRSVSPLALPSPDTADSPHLANNTSSLPRYLLPTESWLCKGPEMHGVHLHSSSDDSHHHHHAGVADHDAEPQPQHPIQDSLARAGGGLARAGGGLARALRLGKNDAPKSVRPFKH